jgi:hypothetical protein
VSDAKRDTLKCCSGDSWTAARRRDAAWRLPLGSIDSSAVAAMMRMRSNAPVRTYSIASGKG